ncbi:MAG TPA: DUF4302 domain-containing protein [Paludibacter sp.]
MKFLINDTMQKINYIVLCLVMLLLGSCAKNEADIFSASPAERMNRALKDDFAALISAPNGWAMEYFATPTSPGYTLLVKFDTSGKATFAAKSELTKNKAYETDSCLFEMIGDNGPVLTFNTYNTVLHRFSNPENPDGYGLEGDYEFVVISKSADQITLKGKKMGTIILLNKIPVDISWAQYVEGLSAMDTLLFVNNSNSLKMKIGTSSYLFSNGSGHVFSIKQGVNTTIEAPFIVTRTGIRFQFVQDIGGVKFHTLKLNDDKSALVSIDNPDLKLVGVEDLAAFFIGNIKVWEFVPTELSPNVKAVYDQIVQSCITNYNATDVKLAIKYYTTRNSFELNLTYTTSQVINDGNLDMTLNATGKNSLSLLCKVTGDNSGLSFYNDVAGFKEMSALISTGFVLSTNSMINPQKIKFTKKTDANTWFTVVPQ